jgi:hypothetical protein
VKNGEKGEAMTLRPVPFSPRAGRRSRQGDEGQRSENKKGQRGHCGALPSLAAVRSDPSVAPVAPRELHDDHLGADLDALEQVDDVLVAQPDAA